MQAIRKGGLKWNTGKWQMFQGARDFHFIPFTPRPSFRELKLRPRGVSRIGCQIEIARVSGPQFRAYFTEDNNKTEMEIRYNLGPDRERKCTTSFLFAPSAQGDMRAEEAETDSFQQNLGKKCILTSLSEAGNTDWDAFGTVVVSIYLEHFFFQGPENGLWIERFFFWGIKAWHFDKFNFFHHSR